MQAVAEAYRNLSRHRRTAAGGHRQPQLRQPRAAGDHGPVRRLRPRHRRRLRRARHADRLGQRQPLQRDRRPGDPADADHRRGRPARLARRADPHGAARRRRRCCCSATTAGHLGQSALLAELFGREEGDAPPVDLARRTGRRRVRARPPGRRAWSRPRTTSPTAGSRVAAAEMALAGDVGVEIFADAELDARRPGSSARTRAATCSPARRTTSTGCWCGPLDAAVPLRVVGEARGGDSGA